MRFCFFNFFAVFILSFFIGCSSDQKKDGLRLALSADIRGFDPALAVDVRSGKLISLVYDNLVHFGDSTNLIPGLSSQWSLSDNRIEYRFLLEKNAYFHDGSPITAQDVVFSFERILNSETLSPQRWLFTRIEGADEFMDGTISSVRGLIAENDSSLILRLKNPFSPFIQYLAMPSASIVNYRQTKNIKEFPAGSGPWMLSKWERDGEIHLIRNQNYWGVKPKEKTLTFRILSEAMTQSAEFEAGNLDFIDIPSTEFHRWTSHPNWSSRVIHHEDLNSWYIGLNCSRPPFNDVRIRKAMNLSIDREKHLQLLIPGGTLAGSAIPPALMRGDKADPYPFDPEQALRLLEVSGYSNGFSTELWVGGGSEMFHVLEAFQSDWASVGINVTLLRRDWNVFKSAIKRGQPPMYYLNWTADYPDAENFLFPLFFSTESMSKRNRYSNPKLDNLILKIQSVSNDSNRMSLVREANDILHHDVPWVFLWHKGSYSMTQHHISGYVPKLVFNAERFIHWVKDDG
jgi:peptide/nickel transport system substrate-binding protein/oligopeptide transport system substrate-binding protein